jgi:hypothetical protein
MAKLSMPGGMSVADKRCGEHNACAKIKNSGKYDTGMQLKTSLGGAKSVQKKKY